MLPCPPPCPTTTTTTRPQTLLLQPAPEGDVTALLIGKQKQKDGVHWFYKQYKEEIPSLETPSAKQPNAKGAAPEPEEPEYYSRRPPGGYGAYPGYDMYKHYEPKEYERPSYGPVS